MAKQNDAYTKISYLKLLRGIAKGEGEGQELFERWAETTKDKEVEKDVRIRALREGEHSIMFRKRVQELSGEDPYPKGIPPLNPEKGLGRTLKIVTDPNMSDEAKYKKMGMHHSIDMQEEKLLTPMFDDQTLDVQTGALMGRWIAEERDSARKHARFYASHFKNETITYPNEDTSQDPYKRISYLKQLRFLAKAEHGGDLVYSKWAETTTDPEVEKDLRIRAVREAEHSMMFRKRVQELCGEDPYASGFTGFSDKDQEERYKMVGDPNISDKEKYERNGYDKPWDPKEPDVFAKIRLMDFEDLDIETGTLIGRFITEERDSARQHHEFYAKKWGGARSKL